jgi:hypothetical protein
MFGYGEDLDIVMHILENTYGGYEPFATKNFISYLLSSFKFLKFI